MNEDNIEMFYRFICFYKRGRKEIDLAHNCLIFGAVLSSKPKKALELGIGNGYATMSILSALKYNGIGTLTSVDNWQDWDGKEPKHIEGLRRMGVNVIEMDEGDFVRNQPDNSYDFLLSDADHTNSGDWAKDVFRIMKPESFMFFHDVEGYDSPKKYVKLCKEKGLAHFVFSKNSLEDEQCNFGMLMAINRKMD